MSGCRLPSPAWKTLAITSPYRREIATTSRMIWGSFERGTTASWSSQLGGSRPAGPRCRGGGPGLRRGPALRPDLRAGTVQLDQQHRPGSLGVPGADALFDGADDRRVQELQGRRDDAGRDDARNSLGGVLDAGEHGEGRLYRLGGVEEPHRDLREGPEGALRADDHPGQAVARALLDFCAAPGGLPRAADGG